jgi:Zn ribbon nucleic-acid-binding protein
MREAVFILLVVLVLLALTAVRYRKQIAGIVGVARLFKDARANFTQHAKQVQKQTEESVPLVNCTKCGVWTPQNKARKIGDLFYCSDECVQMQKIAR